MATIEKKFLDLSGLQNYDTKIKTKITTDDAKVLSDSKSYADSLAENYEPSGSVATLANGQVKTNTDAIASINDTTTGILAQAKSYADTGDTSVQADVDALETLVGTIPEGYTSTTIAGYAKELADAVAANGYDDTALTSRVSANETAIETLNGTGVGSVSKQVADAVAAIVADAPEAYDTLKEISDWISSHSSDAATMNSQINTNKTDIANLTTLIGTLPEGTVSTTIVAYIAEAIGVSETDLTSAIATAKSEAISTASTDATTKANNALASAKTYADGLASNYATAAQGAKADTAVQSIISGVTNGSISVDGTDVAVKGLGTAAYAATSAFDAAGSADSVQTALNTYKTSNDAAVKANADDIDVLETKVASLESVSYVEITEAEIDALFTA